MRKVVTVLNNGDFKPTVHEVDVTVKWQWGRWWVIKVVAWSHGYWELGEIPAWSISEAVLTKLENIALEVYGRPRP